MDPATPSIEQAGRARDNPTLAALSACFAVLCSTSMDAMMKGMSTRYPAHELMFLRAIIALPLVAVIAWRESGPRLFRPPHYALVVLRGVIMCSAYVSFVMAIAAMPMADVVAIYFTMPLFVAGLAGMTLGEKVPLHRVVAIVVGFAGTLLMVRPGGDFFDPAALLALYSAFGYGVGQLLTRFVGAQVKPGVLSFHQNVIYLILALLMAVPFSLVDLKADMHPSLAFMVRPWAVPMKIDLGFVLAMGPLVTSAMYFFSLAYRIGPASFVAPFEYSGMIWAVVFGLLFWGDVPSLSTILGGTLVATAGIVMLRLDTRREKSRRADQLTG
jgi:drug/metabolite transporter (DMT)-like permease